MKKLLPIVIKLSVAASSFSFASPVSALSSYCLIDGREERCFVEYNRGHGFDVFYPRLKRGYSFSSALGGSTHGGYYKVQDLNTYTEIGVWKVFQRGEQTQIVDPASGTRYTFSFTD